ncbi:MAG: hypothetical protein WD749_09155 [Phycisphaerales bacterium]
MFVFALYAVLVWWLAARWRRQWGSFAVVAAGLALLLAVAWLHYLLSLWSEGRIYLPVFQSILYPYIALVTLVGLYIACLPANSRLPLCPACDYDLGGLEDETTSCPECGIPFMMENNRVRRVWADPICPAALAPVSRAPGALATRAPGANSGRPRQRFKQRYRKGPPPTVLHWPPASASP